MNEINAIETLYKGAIFRSRLEARWAAFFDLVRWNWQYEPLDLNGYIPDFILQFYKPLLVEVKPELCQSGLFQHTHKIEASGWNGRAMVLPAAPGFSGSDAGWDCCIGILSQEDPNGGMCWSDANFHKCCHCGNYSVHHALFGWICEVSGCYEGDHFLGRVELSNFQRMWNQAGSVVRWKR